MGRKPNLATNKDYKAVRIALEILANNYTLYLDQPVNDYEQADIDKHINTIKQREIFDKYYQLQFEIVNMLNIMDTCSEDLDVFAYTLEELEELGLDFSREERGYDTQILHKNHTLKQIFYNVRDKIQQLTNILIYFETLGEVWGIEQYTKIVRANFRDFNYLKKVFGKTQYLMQFDDEEFATIKQLTKLRYNNNFYNIFSDPKAMYYTYNVYQFDYRIPVKYGIHEGDNDVQ